MSDSFRSAAAVRAEDLVLRAAGFRRWDGPILHLQPRQRPSRQVVEEWHAEWCRLSPVATELFEQEREGLVALFQSLSAKGSPLEGMGIWDLAGWGWSDFAERGMLPDRPEDHHDGSASWPMSRELVERIIAALASTPPKPWDLLMGVSYFRLWRGDASGTAGEEGAEADEWLGYACGLSSECGYRDDNLYFKLSSARGAVEGGAVDAWPEEKWATSEDDGSGAYGWDLDDGESEDWSAWHSVIGERSRSALEAWIEWREEDEGFTLMPPPAGSMGMDHTHWLTYAHPVTKHAWHCNRPQEDLPAVGGDLLRFEQHWSFDCTISSVAAAGVHTQREARLLAALHALHKHGVNEPQIRRAICRTAMLCDLVPVEPWVFG
jgi:hypothetical protein